MIDPPGTASSIGREAAEISDCNFQAVLKFGAQIQPCSQRSPLLARINFSAASFAQTIFRFDLTRTKPKPALAITFPSNSTCVIYSLGRPLSRKARLTQGAIICIGTTPTKMSKSALLSRRRDETGLASFLPPLDRILPDLPDAYRRCCFTGVMGR